MQYLLFPRSNYRSLQGIFLVLDRTIPRSRTNRLSSRRRLGRNHNHKHATSRQDRQSHRTPSTPTIHKTFWPVPRQYALHAGNYDPILPPANENKPVAPHCHLADYSSIAHTILSPETFFIKDQNPAEFYSATTHGIWDNIPPHVIGLAIGRENAMFLDTHLGVIYWPGGGNFHPAAVGYAMRPDAPFQAIRDESFDYAPEEEMWRNAGSGLKCGWGIEEFFEMLKFQFSRIEFPAYIWTES